MKPHQLILAFGSDLISPIKMLSFMANVNLRNRASSFKNPRNCKQCIDISPDLFILHIDTYASYIADRWVYEHSKMMKTTPLFLTMTIIAATVIILIAFRQFGYPWYGCVWFLDRWWCWMRIHFEWAKQKKEAKYPCNLRMIWFIYEILICV